MEGLIRVKQDLWCSTDHDETILSKAGSDELIILLDGETDIDALHRVHPHEKYGGLAIWEKAQYQYQYRTEFDMDHVKAFYVKSRTPTIPKYLVPELEDIVQSYPKEQFLVDHKHVSWKKDPELSSWESSRITIGDSIVATTPAWGTEWTVVYDPEAVIIHVSQARNQKLSKQEEDDKFLLELRRVIKDKKAPKQDKVTLHRDSRANYFTMPLHAAVVREANKLVSFNVEWPTRYAPYCYREALNYIHTLQMLHPRKSKEDIVIDAMKAAGNHPLQCLYGLMKAVACMPRTWEHFEQYTNHNYNKPDRQCITELFSILRNAYHKELKRVRALKGYKNIGSGAIKRQALREKRKKKATLEKRRHLRKLRAKQKLPKAVRESTYEALLEKIS